MKLSFSKTLLFFILIFSLSLVSFAQSSRAKRGTVNESGADKPLNILFQPPPKLTDEQQEQIKELKKEAIKVKVEFLDIGLIGAVRFNDDLPESINEALTKAAEEIKFEPEMKDGKPITITKEIEYSFIPKRLSEIKVDPENAIKAEAILNRAVEKLGGEKYLNIKTHIGEGKFSLLSNGRNALFQSFVDVIVYPNKERTDFKARGITTIQTNYGDSGWIYDETVETLVNQTEDQVENFKRTMRTNLDNFLRGNWRGEAVLDYVGRRQAGIGKRNEVLKLIFEDGFEVEFEFSDDGFPMKTIYKRMDSSGREIIEEDRFAQFINVQGIKTPFIIDHFTNGERVSRINYESVEFNKTIPDSIFAKPDNIKDAKKKLKF
jgi:hypothetical protein